MGSIIENLNSVFTKLFTSIDQNVFNELDKLVFITPKIISDKTTAKLLGDNFLSGTISISVSIALGVLIFYAFKYLLSHLTFENVQNPISFMFKLFISLFIVLNIKIILENIIFLNNEITKEILSLGSGFFEGEVNFSSLIYKINSSLYILDSSFDFVSLDGVIKIIISFGIINLLLEYALRYVVIKVMCIIAPILIILKSFEDTKYLYTSFIKAFFSILFMQNIVAVILVISTKIEISGYSLMSKLIFLGTIYALIKANKLSTDIFGGISVQNGISIQGMMRGII